MAVLPDADLEMTADAAINAASGSAGERCMAVCVLVVVVAIADDHAVAIEKRMKKLIIGPGTDPASQMGPLITGEHRDRVASYLAGAEAAGASMVVDGRAQNFDSEMVGINVPIPVPVGSFSFGKWKNSLFGDAHIYGPDSIRSYTRGTVVTSRWPDPETPEINLGFSQMS
ncbi:aldehyde dehydrogenase family protein [Cryobacterium ruanii]|uniref:Aldehyde dehydrogenase family protein n=1 Tax=Cryobacterium ruanii TaxID=1259197 RepID=A0A4R9AL92_9MICO|nr:aldehyde dehydrogenase family protein [Cryobacterium ruanii]